MFFRRTSTNTYLYMVRRVNRVWSISSNLTAFNSQYHDEIVDSEGNIWMFVADPTSSPYKIYYRRYTVATDTWGALTVLDIDASYHAAYQSATVDSGGNIYVFYVMNDYGSGTVWQIYYKVFDKVSGIWSERRQFTNGAEYGSAVFPKVRYQTNHQLGKDTIELTYRQNGIGSTTYNIYYGRLTNP